MVAQEQQPVQVVGTWDLTYWTGRDTDKPGYKMLLTLEQDGANLKATLTQMDDGFRGESRSYEAQLKDGNKISFGSY